MNENQQVNLNNSRMLCMDVCTNKGLEEIKKVIGNTPLIEIDGVLAKLETTNPSGSIKDRIASFMIEEAEKRWELKKGMKIIEVTTGNTGIALSLVSLIKGYEFLAVTPEFVSDERKKMMKMFGAQIVLTPASENMNGAVKKYEELIKENPNAWLPRQFENEDNLIAHELGLGKEIIDETFGEIDAFVAGMGTGGTLIGVARALKKVNPNIKIFGIEPEESPIITKGYSGAHKIQGIGEGFIPKLIKENMSLIDDVIRVSSEDAMKMRIEIVKKHGFFVGISSGANFLVAKELKKKYPRVVTVLPERGERYLSLD